MDEVQFDKDRAIAEATRIFWTKGYSDTSLKDLLEAMGILNGSFYNTFKSKKHLFKLAIEHYSQHVLKKRLDILQSAADPLTGLQEFFSSMTADFSSTRFPRGCLIVNSCSSTLMQDRELAQLVRNQIDQLQAGLLARCKNVPNADAIAHFLTTFTQGLAVSSLRGDSRKSMQKACEMALHSSFGPSLPSR